MKTTHTSTPINDSHAVIKPIETQYKGYRFRSRLEARWAVFFDALGLKWEYEPEGFELPSGRYLPDFWLPRFTEWRGAGRYVEVKGLAPTPLEMQLGRELATLKQTNWVLVQGDPLNVTATWIGRTGKEMPKTYYCLGEIGNALHTLGGAGWKPGTRHYDAAVAARGARFEHGESGARA